LAKILIIDDEEALRDSIRELLESKGHEVSDAPDGATGTSMFKEQGADVVITDLIMPYQDGIETIRNLRRHSQTLKIIALSGRGGHQIKANLERAEFFGADATIQKPCEPTTLVSVIDSLISNPS
jgi:DNA-binding response OmpR family regulator